jgi:hypothetical protein
MPGTSGTLETIALELGKLLKPLEQLLGPSIFVKLGVELPRSISGDAGIIGKLTAAATKAGELDPKITSLATAISSDDTNSIISAAVPLIANIAELIALLVEVGDAVSSAANSLPPSDKTQLQQFAETMAVRTLEYMSVGYLDDRLPSLTSSFDLLGIIDKEFKPSASLEVSNAPKEIIPRRFYLDRIPKLLSHPDQYLQDVFKWGANDFDGTMLLRKIQALLESFGVPAIIYQTLGQPAVLEAYIFNIQVDNSVTPPGFKFDLSLPGNTTFDKQIDFSSLWKGTVHVEANYAAGIEATLHPPFTFNAKPPSGNIALTLMLGLKAENSSGDPVIILGVTGGTRLQAKSISGSVGINASLGTSGGEISPAIQLKIEEGKLIIDFSQGDGFIQSLLSGVHFEGDFSLEADWDPVKGLRLHGSGGVELFIPVHIDLTVVVINGIYFAIKFSGSDPPLQIGLATQITANLGPLVAVVDHIGVNIGISFPSDGSGRLGMADIDFQFQPPKGVGLSLDTGVIKGGGFLYLDYDKGQYYGALELSLEDVINLKAVGIINTKMPDGSTGFALLILVTAEFTPIQLGFGFTLNGVGGLLGLNHSTDIAALQAGVKTGAVNSILFPPDVVANITRIISDLQTIFPIVQGHFIITPMGKVGWFTPPLVTLELGIIIDIPTPALVIIGILACILPTEDAPILKLQVNFAGGIDFDKGLIWFDASLFDSSLLIFTLSGDMALRIGWGDNPMFVISIGGFHPAFHEVPSDLTNMKRLTIALLSGDNPRLTAQTYFAITSNSVQSGAKVELYAEACGFNVYGYLGYDLLVQFNPFYFIADIYAGLALRSGTDVIMGISVFCELSGPTPWHAKGDASLTILFFTITVGFDVTWGDSAPPQVVESEDVLKLVSDALSDSRNWKSGIPANSNLSVSLKAINLPPEQIILHPFGILSVSQKVVPLQLNINKFGNKKPAADTYFDMTYGGGSTIYTDEQFAMANFIQMSDSEKLARKSFEQMKSGLTFQGSDTTSHGVEMDKEVTYELTYVHKKKMLFIKAGIFRLFASIFNVTVKGNSIYKSSYSVSKKISTNAPAKVEVSKPGYSVVNTSDMQLHTGTSAVASEAEAYMLHDTLIAQDPSLKDSLQVVSNFELN